MNKNKDEDIGSTVLSWKRIRFYYIKYWYVIIGFMIGAIIILGGRIYKNMNSSAENNKITVAKGTYIIEKRLENPVSTVSVLGDCKVLLNTRDMLQYVNNRLKEDNLSEIKDFDNVQVNIINESNCFEIVISGEDEKESALLLEIVPEYWETQMKEIYGEINYTLLEKSVNLEMKEVTTSLVTLKDLIIFAIIFVFGVALVYFIMIIDDRIISEDEVRKIIKCDKLQLIEDKNMFEMWANHQKHIGGYVAVTYGDGLEEYFKILKDYFENINKLGEEIKEKDCADRYLIIRKGYIKDKELSRYNNELILIDQNLKGILFVDE